MSRHDIVWKLYILLIVALFFASAFNPAYNDRFRKSNEILKYMNTSVDPCEDFYEFTCAKYGKYHPSNETYHMIYEIMVSSENKTKEILLSNDPSDLDIDRKVKDVFKSCLNVPTYVAKNPEIYRGLASEFGQMPALVGEEWPENEFDWLQTVAAINYKYGLDIINECTVMRDFTDNSINSVYIGEATLEYNSKAMYTEKEYGYVLQEFVEKVKKNLKEYLDIEEELAGQTAKEIVEFETALAQGMPDNRVIIPFNEIYVPTPLNELHRKYLPSWNVSDQIQRTFGSIPSMQINVNHIFMQNLIAVLAKTPKRIVANYVHYKFVEKFFFEFPKPINDVTNQNICLQAMKRYYGKNFFNMFYRKLNLKETEEEVHQMWNHLKSTFRETLNSERLQWQNSDTRQAAIEKLDAMKLSFGSYEDYDFHNDASNFKPDKENFFENLKTVIAGQGFYKRELVNKPPQTFDISYVISMSPGYMQTENVIYVPVSFLQPLFVLSKSYPYAYNFAVMGSVLAHELMHGFDDGGRGFDAKGNIRNWWDDKATGIYNERVKCFTNQYKEFKFNGKYLPESSAQSENIADNGGIRLAYEAYLKWYNNAGHFKRDREFLPGINCDHKQLFFIGNAHLWCSNSISDADDTHTPEKFRVIGSLSNFNEFSKAFNCPVGSPMNPQNKCEIF